jgi:2-keto-3-deoxy-L-fuconate dehydrogenase
VSQRLAGKTCFVTGAAQGIGRAAVDAMLKEGAHVIAADLQYATRSAPNQDRLIAIGLDVTDAAAVERAARAHREVSVLLNCAGVVANGTVLECTDAEFDGSFNVNVKSMFNTLRAFLPTMRERRDGSIINIASVVSSVKGAPNRFAYGTSKGAVIGLTKSIARDFIQEGIRCNAISPGTVQTPSLDERMAASGDIEAARAAFIGRQPMGRLGSSAEIAAVIVLLASDEAKFMTGSNVVIDGGWSL